MEAGSLLPQALQYMQTLRDQNHDLPIDVLFNGDGNNNDISETEHDGVETQRYERNALVISLYCIDSPNDVELTPDRNKSSSDCSSVHQNNKNLQKLHQKLASIHSILHSILLPGYRSKYQHTWFMGGEGIAFGLHCQDDYITNSSSHPTKDNRIPHLRAMIYYGPHPLDEYYALALAFQLTQDLYEKYNYRVAASCWDVDDGQILLIEGADALPSWVDDDIGVEGMSRRVYVERGLIRLLPPSTQGLACDGSRTLYITRREALIGLMAQIHRTDGDRGGDRDDSSIAKLNEIVKRRLDPFLESIQFQPTTSHHSKKNKKADLVQSMTQNNIDGTTRLLLKEYIHTAAIVLPLPLALLLEQRPDLLPCAILSFCREAPIQLNKKKAKKKNQSHTNEGSSPPPFLFENLVFTTITISKTLYAMLLTAAGQLPPPIKVPKHYKSIEVNRIKRQCLSSNDADAFHHFRHALEIGMRLSLGFEWLLSRDSKSDDNTLMTISGDKFESKEMPSSSLINTSIEERINTHHTRIVREASIGNNDGEWIRSAFKQGPNDTSEEDNISELIKCPVWDPEIKRGGICALKYPGKTTYTHVKESLSKIEKQDLSSINTIRKYPLPHVHDVDPDSWVDMNSMDCLETKMNEVVGDKMKSEKMDGKKDSKREGSDKDGHNISIGKSNDKNTKSTTGGIDDMLTGLQNFVNKKSSFEGIASTSITKDTQKSDDGTNYHKNDHDQEEKRQTAKNIGPHSRKMDDTCKPIRIDPNVFFRTFYTVLKETPESPENEHHDTNFGETQPESTDELLKYFSHQDLGSPSDSDGSDDEVDSLNSDSNEEKGNNSDEALKNVMNEMDKELMEQGLNMNDSISSSESNDEKDNGELPLLSQDDPLSQQVHLVSNLMKSLDAQGGGSGPITTLLGEMGIQAPDTI